MAVPQKKRGFRKLVIANQTFNWRFNSLAEVCPAACNDNKLMVDIGWLDPWLYRNDPSTVPINNDPKIVTPFFVRQAIDFALSQHWDITAKTGLTKIVYRDSQFAVAS